MSWLTVALITTVLLLVFVSAVHPPHSRVSLFELKRRAKEGDRSATRDLKRERLLRDVVSLLAAFSSILLVIVVLLSVTVFGWVLGSAVAIFIAIGYRVIAHLGIIRKTALKLYRPLENDFLKFVSRVPYLMAFLRSVPKNTSENTLKINSLQELQYLIQESDDVLSPKEKDLITHSLSFGDKLVRDVMTPREKINSISRHEMLGPLVLDELHKTGHDKLPVTGRDIDHVVGVLYINNLLSLDVRHSITVTKAMVPKVFHIDEAQPLSEALKMFLNNDTRLLIVLDKNQKTAGLVTLSDVIESLTGQKPDDN